MWQADFRQGAAARGVVVWGGASALLLAAAVGVLSWSARAPVPAVPVAAVAPPATRSVPASIAFARNIGQAPAAVRYTAQGRRHAVAIFDDGMAFAAAGGATASLRFEGARAPAPFTEREPLAARAHRLQGRDPAAWQRDIPLLAQVRQAGLYRGIDLVYYSRDGDFEFDLVVQPGADPAQIRLRHGGPKAPAIDAEGRLRLDGPDGVLTVPRPVLQQHADGQRITRNAQWRLDADGTIGLDLPAYDRSRVLVIDPVFKLLVSTYLGGVHDDQVGQMALDAQGNAFVVGFSGSEDWPVSGNAWQRTRQALGRYVRNVVVSKFDAAGTLLWSTFLGGSVNDFGQAIALDAKGQVVVAGYTNSPDFPTSTDALQRTLAGGQSAFVAVLSPDGSNLVHSTLYGGAGGALAFDIALDGSGRLWSVGWGGSGLPTTPGSYKPTLAGAGNAAYLARFTPTTAPPLRLEAASYFGTDNAPADRLFTGNAAYALALAPGGGVWIAGQARHEVLPTTADALQAAPTAIDHNGQIGALPLCAFGYIARLSGDLRSLEYASYLTGYTREARDRSSCAEYARSVAVAPNGDLLVTGSTSSDRFPTTGGALQAAYPGAGGFIGHSGFAARLRADGRSLVWSTYVGGNGGDSFVNGLNFDAASNAAWVFGVTAGGANFPLSADAQQATFGGGTYDAGLTRLDAATGALQYGSYAGGSGDDNPTALRSDGNGNIVLAGGTDSRNFAVTPGAFQPTYTPNAFDGADAFFRILGSATIGSVRPAAVAGGGDVTLTVSGAGLEDDLKATLVAPDGTRTPAGAAVVSSRDGRFTFTLTAGASGAYDLELRFADGRVVQRRAAVTVGGGAAPALSVQVLGRPKIRTGVPSTYNVVVTNSGNVDAYLVPLWITLPSAVRAQVAGLDLAPAAQGAWFGDGSRNRIPQLIPVVAAGESVTVPVVVTAPQDLADIPIVGALQAPWFRTQEQVRAFAASTTYRAECVPDTAVPAFVDCSGLYFAYLSNGLVPLEPAATVPAAPLQLRATATPAGCDGPLGPFGGGSAAAASDKAAKQKYGNTHNPYDNSGQNSEWLQWQSGYNATWVAGGTPGPSATAAKRVPAANAAATATACPLPPLPSPPPTQQPTGGGGGGAGGAIDPNDKVGPLGSGAPAHHVRAATPLNYQIAFENLAGAALPAAEVVVTDRLDATRYDLSTLSLGAIDWGPHHVDVPPGLSSFATVFAIDATLSVRIAASLDPTTGVLKWTFTTVDPATRLPPSDPTLGFLPPNRNGTEGQGYVSFRVLPKAGLPDGTRWENKASIVFDANAAIETPTWVNTLDSTAPTSRVSAATAKAGSGEIDVTWSGNDGGAGVKTYAVWVSEDGGAFTVWQRDTTATGATWAGTVGRRYAFHAIATDGAGNVEAAKTTGEAVATAGSAEDDGGAGGGGGGCTIAPAGRADATLLLLLAAACGGALRRRASRPRGARP